MNINNTDLPEALAFHATTYADYLQRASYTTVCPPLAPPSALLPLDGAETATT